MRPSRKRCVSDAQNSILRMNLVCVCCQNSIPGALVSRASYYLHTRVRRVLCCLSDDLRVPRMVFWQSMLLRPRTLENLKTQGATLTGIRNISCPKHHSGTKSRGADFGKPTFRLRLPHKTAQEGPRGPKTNQDGPKLAPSQPKRVPRRPKMAPRRPKMTPRWPQDGPRWPQDSPRWPQDGPRWSQDGPRWPQDDPRWPQDGPR